MAAFVAIKRARMKIKKLSIVVPCYNEAPTIPAIYSALQNLELGRQKEIIIIDDGSTDGSRAYLKKEEEELPLLSETVIIFHPENRGKGACIRSALEHASGDYLIIQDADLEYAPEQIPALVRHAEATGAAAVYGSRNSTIANASSSRFFALGVRWLTKLFNILYGQKITDVETCYKLVKTELMKTLHLTEDGFGFEIDISAKISRRGFRIAEVPIRYTPRRLNEGKKMRVRDGLRAFYLLLGFRFFARNS